MVTYQIKLYHITLRLLRQGRPLCESTVGFYSAMVLLVTVADALSV